MRTNETTHRSLAALIGVITFVSSHLLSSSAVMAVDESGTNQAESPDGADALPAIEELDLLGDGLGELDDELLLFEDIPVVVSASRQPTPVNRRTSTRSCARRLSSKG